MVALKGIKMNNTAIVVSQAWIKGESTKEQIVWCDAVRWFNDASIEEVMGFIDGIRVNDVKDSAEWYKQVIEAKQQELLS